MVEVTTKRIGGQESYGGFECLWAGTPSAGGGAAVFSQMPQRACLSYGVETKARTLSCGFRVLPILPLIPCLISGAWKAGKKQAWPSHPPSKHNHIALKNSTQPSPAIPHPMPHLSGTEKPKHAKTHGCYAYYQGENKSPIRLNFLTKTVTTRWPCSPIDRSSFSLPFTEKASGNFLLPYPDTAEREPCLGLPLTGEPPRLFYPLVSKGIRAQVPISDSRVHTASLEMSSSGLERWLRG